MVKPVSIPLCVPEIHGNEWTYLKECLDTNWVSSAGRFVDRFERDVANTLQASEAVAVVNGTAALHMALLVAGVESGDEVLVSSLTFIAPANAVRYLGAWPVFIDAEPDYWQMSPDALRDFITTQCTQRGKELWNRGSGRRVRAILPVHILGHPVDIDPIMELAQHFGLTVIEDATEGLGARYKDRPVGNLCDIGCLSFNGNKLLTTGGGGMLVSNRSDWAARARYLSTQAKSDPEEYIHEELGFNNRLTNLQAAMGCAQWEKLDEYIGAKRAHADIYRQQLADIPGITVMNEASWASSVYWLYTVLVDEQDYGRSNQALREHLRTLGIATRTLWQPLHLSPAHHGSGSPACPSAERIYRHALSLPSSVGLTLGEQEYITSAIRAAQQ